MRSRRGPTFRKRTSIAPRLCSAWVATTRPSPATTRCCGRFPVIHRPSTIAAPRCRRSVATRTRWRATRWPSPRGRTTSDALNNRANALLRLERFAEALASYERAAALGSETAETLQNRGNALHELGRHAEALALYDKSLALDPDRAATRNNRGAALQALERYDEALASYAKALALAPGYAEAHYNDALCRILVGDYGRGWEELEWRWQTPALAPYHRRFPQPLWQGDEEVSGKTLLLHAEFGFGDTLQFCRYAGALAERGARVVMEAPAPLAPLLTSLRGVAAVVVAGEPLPPFDLHCPVMSLPHAFRTTLATIPAVVPYVAPPPERLVRWAARLGPRNAPRIGLAWAGNPAQANDRNRSLRFEQVRPLLIPGVRWVSLQKDVRARDRTALAAAPEFARFEDELSDFADTAALIAQLDLVVTVDTSVAHLVGALGKPAWVMLSKPTDWHYPLAGDASPWYPTMRLFRQPRPGDWAERRAARRGRTVGVCGGAPQHRTGATDGLNEQRGTRRARCAFADIARHLASPRDRRRRRWNPAVIDARGQGAILDWPWALATSDGYSPSPEKTDHLRHLSLQ